MRKSNALLFMILFVIVTVSGSTTAASQTGASSEKPQPKVTEGKLLQRVAPVYPPDAKALRVSGVVALQAVIGKDGLLNSITVVSGPDLLRQAAIDCVKQWKYQPYLLGGEPVEVKTTLNIVFTLGDGVPPQQNQVAAQAPAEPLQSPPGSGQTHSGILAPVTPNSPPPQPLPNPSSVSVRNTRVFTESVSALRDVDFKNRAYELNGREVQVKGGVYKHQDSEGFEDITVRDIWFLTEPSDGSQFALVFMDDDSGSGSSNDKGVIQVFTVTRGRLQLVQELLFDEKANGVGARFDANSRRLTIRSRSDDGSPRCCPEYLDLAEFAWNGQGFVFNSVAKLSIKTGKVAGAADAQRDAEASARQEALREGILVDSPARALARRRYATLLESTLRGILRSNPGYDPSLVGLRVYTATPNPEHPLPPEVVRQDYRLTIETNGVTLPQDVTALLRNDRLNSQPKNLGFVEMVIQDTVGVHLGTILCAVGFQQNGAHPSYCMRENGVDIVQWDVYHQWPSDYVVHDEH